MATDDDRYIYRTKTMMEDRGRGREEPEEKDYRAVKRLGKGVAG